MFICDYHRNLRFTINVRIIIANNVKNTQYTDCVLFYYMYSITLVLKHWRHSQIIDNPARNTCVVHVCVRSPKTPRNTTAAVVILWPRMTPHLRRQLKPGKQLQVPCPDVEAVIVAVVSRGNTMYSNDGYFKNRNTLYRTGQL